MQQLKASAAFSDTKPHYDLLDGLRGVAAILVLWYHVFEGYAFLDFTLIACTFSFFAAPRALSIFL